MLALVSLVSCREEKVAASPVAEDNAAVIQEVQKSIWRHIVLPARDPQTGLQFPKTPIKPLFLGDVLAWSTIYRDLIGADASVALKRFGGNDLKTNHGILWVTLDGIRSVAISNSQQIKAVCVGPSDEDHLDLMDILRRADQFKITSGHYSDTKDLYIRADSLDGTISLRFDMQAPGYPQFEAAIIKSPDLQLP
jgi:hypothetical protein